MTLRLTGTAGGYIALAVLTADIHFIHVDRVQYPITRRSVRILHAYVNFPLHI